MTADKIYTVQEAADYLRIKPRTLREYVKDGRIRAFRLGKDWRIKQSAIDEYTKQHENIAGD